MGIIKTKVINDTAVRIDLKQGSAGVFSKLHALEPSGNRGSTYTIKLESGTTYREYWCAQVQPGSAADERKVIFSSDDCGEYMEVKIVQVQGSQSYEWEGTKRRDGGAVAAAAQQPTPAQQLVPTPAQQPVPTPAQQPVPTPSQQPVPTPAQQPGLTPAQPTPAQQRVPPGSARVSRWQWHTRLFK